MIRLLLLVFLIYSCTPDKQDKPKINLNENKQSYKRIKNSHWKECRHKESIKIILEIKLEHYLSTNKLPKKSLSQWFLDQHDPEYCSPKITKELDEFMVTVISDVARKCSINYDAIDNDSLTVIKIESQ
jgi:hypothetical protein